MTPSLSLGSPDPSVFCLRVEIAPSQLTSTLDTDPWHLNVRAKKAASAPCGASQKQMTTRVFLREALKRADAAFPSPRVLAAGQKASPKVAGY